MTGMEEDRAAFEAYAKASGLYSDWSKSPGGSVPKGEYLKPRVQEAWLAWQAACAHARRRPNALQEMDERHAEKGIYPVGDPRNK